MDIENNQEEFDDTKLLEGEEDLDFDVEIDEIPD